MNKKVDPEESLVKLFGSVSRARILEFLYAFSGQSFYQREIVFETGLALRAVQRELDNLAALPFLQTPQRNLQRFSRGSLPRISWKAIVRRNLGGKLF